MAARRHCLWDLRALNRGPSSAEDLRELAHFPDRLAPVFRGSRAAILVHRDVDFGIARMFDAYASDIGVEYNFFREPDEALAGLRSPPRDDDSNENSDENSDENTDGG